MMNRETDYNTRETQLRVAPAQLAIVHLVENWVPLRRAYICPIVFIEAFAWSTVVLPDFQGFPNLEVVCKPFFVFV